MRVLKARRLSGQICVDDPSLEVKRSGPAVPLVARLVEREKEIIEAALAQSRGRISGRSGAAAKLGIPRQTLNSKIKALGIDKHPFKAR